MCVHTPHLQIAVSNLDVCVCSLYWRNVCVCIFLICSCLCVWNSNLDRLSGSMVITPVTLKKKIINMIPSISLPLVIEEIWKSKVLMRGGEERKEKQFRLKEGKGKKRRKLWEERTLKTEICGRGTEEKYRGRREREEKYSKGKEIKEQERRNKSTEMERWEHEGWRRQWESKKRKRKENEHENMRWEKKKDRGGRGCRREQQHREWCWFGYRPACTGLLTAALMSLNQWGSWGAERPAGSRNAWSDPLPPG